MHRTEALACALMALAIRGLAGQETPRDIRAVIVVISDELRWGYRTISEAAALFAAWATLADPKRRPYWLRARRLAGQAMEPLRTDGRREEAAHA